MPERISLAGFQSMLDDPSVPDSEIAEYLKAESGVGAFDPVFVPDPELVDTGREERGMVIGNRICRQRRRARFWWRRRNGVDLPVIVTEGDSWFQFPFLIEDVVDHLDAGYLAYSCGAAGDTARNMIFDAPEYMSALDEQAKDVAAFLLSAAGNDVIGADENGVPALERILHRRSDAKRTAHQLVNKTELNRVLAALREGYETVVRTIRSDARFANLPILFHGYDYALPFPAGARDPRDPPYAGRDHWLGAPMAAKEIDDPELRREIVEILIDALYDMLESVAETDQHVHVVDIRGTLPRLRDWTDEIHATSDGFARVAERFSGVLRDVVRQRPPRIAGIPGPEGTVPAPEIDVEIREMNLLKDRIEDLDPALLGFGDVDKFASGFARTRERIARRATPEMAIDDDDSLPFRFLANGAEVGRAVCKLTCEGISFNGRSGRWRGTGFLVAPNLLLTNNHVINSAEVARSARAIFDFYEESAGRFAATTTFTLNPERLFISSAFSELDYSFVWIDGAPHESFGTIPFWRGSFMARDRANANIVHHPQGQPKRSSIKNNQVVDLGKREVLIHYATDTDQGSSGSPVLTDDWRLFALHHAVSEALPDEIRTRILNQIGRDVTVLNEGIKTSAIAIDIDRRAARGPDQAAARHVQSYLGGTDSRTGYFGSLGRSGKGEGLEAVVDTYRGTSEDVDIAFWNVEWFNRRYEEKIDDVARIVADLSLDIWAMEETSPQATEALVDYLNSTFGQSFNFAASEPGAASGRQSTTVMWNTRTVDGVRLDWPEEIHSLLKLRSDDPEARRFEAVEGRIFDRYPGLFRFTALHQPAGAPPFDFNLVPVHLKAKSEGAKRRRMASAILARAVELTSGTGVAENDWIIGGDFNAELATGEFDPLQDAGFRSMSAADEKGGAVTYLNRPHRSLIDSIFLSPGFRPRVDADDFMIVAQDRRDSGFVTRVSDHRPVMLRLSISEEPRIRRAPVAATAAPRPPERERPYLDIFAEEVKRDPAQVLADLATRFRKD
ncbi:trypsin-like peptidase domain-containing protein [Tropicimonas sp. IMCC6043]|uniref:trypsin-like peptidase domain-containing protein n=1 Tax=Tropicimonas sp. IMCC6043 TaxID=2510645 RepID=UPI00101C187A|nr:trypsin-like peptidase domain-containing protein [Tropicimonas sp. IMCC6043]RYH09187.1 hypothetical protein EU800_13340 [Tropicimonas sp. IMCC6043]